MQIKKMALGAYCTNCYVLWDEGADACILIDPGDEPERILQELNRLEKQPEAILITHGHFDHVGAVRYLAEKTGCRVYICEEDLALPSMLRGGELYYTHTYAQGDCITHGGLTFHIMQTPGHSAGSVCLISGDVIFSGDTLFAGTCGRTDFPGSDPVEMKNSLARLAGLPGDYRVFPGHGEETTLNAERRSNPYMYGL